MKLDPTLNLAAIGNGNISALLDRSGAIVWMCWPRVDGDPVFCALVNGAIPKDGYFSIGFDDDDATYEQSYVRNTAIVRTVVTSADGAAAFSIVDFAPRFPQFGRYYNPPMIVRRVEPLRGLCRIRVNMRPRMVWGRLQPTRAVGSNHIRYASEIGAIRLSSDAPASFLATDGAFILSQPTMFILHADEPMTNSISRVAREFHDQTRDAWHDWVRNLSLPFEWQEEVIRAAITLQLCSFEQTGAIVAALTTSLPEAAGTSACCQRT